MKRIDNLKEIMDQELKDINVTEKLKKATLHNMKHQPKKYTFNVKKVSKIVALAACFIFIIGLNLHYLVSPNEKNMDYGSDERYNEKVPLTPNELDENADDENSEDNQENE